MCSTRGWIQALDHASCVLNHFASAEWANLLNKNKQQTVVASRSDFQTHEKSQHIPLSFVSKTHKSNGNGRQRFGNTKGSWDIFWVSKLRNSERAAICTCCWSPLCLAIQKLSFSKGEKKLTTNLSPYWKYIAGTSSKKESLLHASIRGNNRREQWSQNHRHSVLTILRAKPNWTMGSPTGVALPQLPSTLKRLYGLIMLYSLRPAEWYKIIIYKY